MATLQFPKGFVWGTATASYQVEGGAFEDGRGLSVWDMLCRKPGAIYNGHSGATACDQYHRYAEDIALMRELGAQGHRFSLSWPRILPEGVGAVNAKGLDYYDRFIDGLLAAGVQPYVTLFHWDYPYELYCKGGWLNPDSPRWFADYAALVVERYSDRVTHWMTHNEPQCFVWLGHSVGVHAPGDKLGWAEVLRVGHNALLAHGRAVQAMRAAAKQPIQIGFAPVSSQAIPADPNNPADVDAARQATFAVRGQDFWNNTWFSDPIFLKRYPEDGVALYGDAMPAIGADDFEIIGQPIDFYGANIYQGVVVRAGANGPELVPFPDGYPHTAFPWPVTPEALYWGPRFLYERYKTPIYITENGLASMDWVGIDQRVHDRGRIDFTTRYLAELHRATRDGVDVRGYFHWSLLDNFEWAEGYKQRFGLVHVDFATLARTPKDSFVWYQGVVRANGF